MAGDLALSQYVLIAGMSFMASVIGGVAGYGTGLLMPLVLVPAIGAEAVVPVISLSALFNNASRVAAYRELVDWRKAAVIFIAAAPTSVIGAWFYTRLSSAAAAFLIGAVLIVLVPARRLLRRIDRRIEGRGLVGAGAAYGLIVGGTSGSGVILLSILLAAGLEGRAVIATDACVSFGIGILKTGVFQTAGALPLSSWIVALVMGVAATPGAFVARRLTDGLAAKWHVLILDAVVVLGGLLLIAQAVRTHLWP